MKCGTCMWDVVPGEAEGGLSLSLGALLLLLLPLGRPTWLVATERSMDEPRLSFRVLVRYGLRMGVEE